MSTTFNYGFTLDNGTCIVHGEGVNVKSSFPPELDIPGVMHVFNVGNASDPTTPAFKGSFGVLPFDVATRMPRHVHLSTEPTGKRLLVEKVLVMNGVALVELAGDIYVIPPMTLVIIAAGVPHTWTACPPGLNMQRVLGLEEEVVSEGHFIAVYEHEDDTAFCPTAQVTPLRHADDPVVRPSPRISHGTSQDDTGEPETGDSDALKVRSLSSLFEAFLNQNNSSNAKQRGLFLLGEPSPLTYALSEFPEHLRPQMHDPSGDIRGSSTLQVIRQGVHPSHLKVADIAYLDAKGAFTSPTISTLDALISVFLERFDPFYSIVDTVELEKVYQDRKLPWLLQHAICFIGTTFCDMSVIHRTDFDSRLSARRHYYEKAKALFDIGYETSKIILLQTALMLSFWGPQTGAYWNPCSWIEFGVTIAVSLGLHRSASSSNTPTNSKGLLRRLWWTLAGRDTHCSVLLGRPFRINLTQCDVEMLNENDFNQNFQVGSFYQIHVAKLSLIIRDIVHRRFGPGEYHISPDDAHTRLDSWYSTLNTSLNRWEAGSPPFQCSTALEILYHYSLLLLFIRTLSTPQQRDHHCQQFGGDIQVQLVDQAAKKISSKAVTLMTEGAVCALPHEVFPGFFLAAIVLYRQKRQKSGAEAQLAHATFDHCRIVLNETRESWDLGRWAMHTFEFLRTNCKDDHSQLPGIPTSPRSISVVPQPNEVTALDLGASQIETAINPTWGDFPDQHVPGSMEDLLYMPDLFSNGEGGNLFFDYNMSQNG
ncbi:hypothetical protein AK830_g136 [Neonectria ditissima]|uniref:Xylanolytic transcriptional activator regulatory domain-containing protein n=1 Tax=Neonectria ditissima TaxID=78410 RepID=A0A0N8H941_9HYPO|nr:hypothetical protein AK830_g136 [Neonectria ditissima]